MSLKLLLFTVLVALSSIEARQFLKSLRETDLTLPFSQKSSHRAVDTLFRRRRDAEETNTSPEITDQDALDLLKFFVAAAWETDKLEVLGGFLEEVSDKETNLTVIGWQRVLDDQGKIKEIRSIQVVIPPKPEEVPANIVHDDEDDEDDERVLPYSELKEIREYLDPIAALGIPSSVTYEEFNKQGELEALLYLEKDELYAYSEGSAIYNKTSIASSEDVSKFVASLKPKALGKPSVLKYDVDGKLLVDQSHIRPHILGSVNDHYEASDKILTEAPQVIAQISQQYPQSEIPKQLAIYYNKKHPEYKWRVLVSPQNYAVTRDIELDLTYDNFDLDENSGVRYVVYGVKKNSTNK